MVEQNRAWRNRVKKQVRAQIKVEEGKRDAALLPSARTLYDRRHAVLAIGGSPEDPTVTYLRACTCVKAAPHTEDGRTVHLDLAGLAR